MIRIVFLALCIIAPIFPSYSFDTSIRGFIALDVLSVIKQEGEKQEAETGIGTLDIKVYATHEDFSFKLKLDLDDSRIGDAGNLFEEATVSYRLLPDHQLIMGKGKVSFHQMHYGAISTSYTDGGSNFNTDHSVRDFDNRLLLSWRSGGFAKGFFNYLTYWGNSQQAQLNSDGTPRIVSGRLQFSNEKTFSSKEEAGVANRLEWFFNRELSASVGGIYYYNNLNPKNSWAMNLASRYTSKNVEIWAEYIRGFTSTHPSANFATFKKNEHLFQIGTEIYLTELYNFVTNAEAVLVNNQKHFETGSSFNNGQKLETDTYKYEAAIKIKFQKEAFMVLGGQIEKQNEVIKATGLDKSEYAYQLASKVSFWF